MSRALNSLLALFTLFGLVGCGSVGARRDVEAKTTGVSSRGKLPKDQLVKGNGSSREPPLADPSTMIPPPPNMNFPEVPPPPGKDDSLAINLSPDPSGITTASGIVVPGRTTVERARAVAADNPAASNLEALRCLHQRAIEQFEKLSGFECRLTRRETVGTKAMPEEVLHYKHRREPYSLHIKWIGKEAQGRELVYVQGKYDNKVQILTGREPELFRPSGIRVSRLPADKDMTSKSRYDIRLSGLGLSIEWLGRVVALMENDPSQVNRITYLGPKPRREREIGLEAIEESIPMDWEPLLPKGGRRTTYFDADPGSPSFGLPVLIVTFGDNGREVEYYWFDQLRPLRLTDADFDPDRLWKR